MACSGGNAIWVMIIIYNLTYIPVYVTCNVDAAFHTSITCGPQPLADVMKSFCAHSF